MEEALPDFLAEFDHDALRSSAEVLVAIDAEGTILWFSRTWEAFARENAGDEVRRRFGVGANYFAGISPELREHFRAAFTRALETATPFTQEYECSSVERYRLHRLRALPLGTGLLLEHALIDERPHDRVAVNEWFDPRGLIVQCSNCRKTLSADGTRWVWVAAWVAHPPRGTSHGLCPICTGYYYGRI